jgi:S-adenosylmethionine-diacylgycerolhomoserine-N-methlytransferase
MPLAFLSDLKILYHLALAPVRGKTHAERLESFYSGQAQDYDAFRKRLLHGREALYESLSPPEHGVWVDMGGGTGANIEMMGATVSALAKTYIVDLSPSLLSMARERIDANGWTNVEAVEADATTFEPPEGQVDVVTFSYSLTMIPDWYAALDHALSILKPGGHIGVVDFFVSRKHTAETMDQHPWRTRWFWPLWFANDNVFISPDHVPYLHERFEPVHFSQHRGKVPYLPAGRVPYYRFIGRKAE